MSKLIFLQNLPSPSLDDLALFYTDISSISGISDTEITNLGILVGEPISKTLKVVVSELELELEDPD